MQENDLTREPEYGTVYGFVTTFDSRGVHDGDLKVVTEDGRALRITGIRYPDGVAAGAEIVVAEEGA
jgi:hypothetical protein